VVTNSPTTAAVRSGKRERLVTAARDLVYRHGVVGTTLADIAEAAGVPLGNVYYYFKTKEDIVAAVVQASRERIEETLADVERRHRSPKARLKAFVGVLAERADETAQYGCPNGTLSSELAKRAEGSDPSAAPLMQVQLDWAEREFRALGRGDAQDLAVELVAAYQGVAVLASTLGQPDLVVRQARRLQRWIDTLDT
jgi:AcrR family transcriptional regulator